jgi:hypothetical protein
MELWLRCSAAVRPTLPEDGAGDAMRRRGGCSVRGWGRSCSGLGVGCWERMTPPIIHDLTCQCLGSSCSGPTSRPLRSLVVAGPHAALFVIGCAGPTQSGNKAAHASGWSDMSPGPTRQHVNVKGGTIPKRPHPSTCNGQVNAFDLTQLSVRAFARA